jgi:3-methyl-2-oxobutanoate hydroxymethyltransferase
MYNNSQSAETKVTPLTVPQLRARKHGEKIASLTAYDSSFAGTIDRAGVDLILIGDSLGMVIQGHDNTLRVTIDSIVYHTRSVCRATQRALVMSDMPFGAYGDEKTAYKNAVKCIAAGAEMVKLEGAGPVVDAIAYLNKRDIPVCAHLGLTPQSVHNSVVIGCRVAMKIAPNN